MMMGVAQVALSLDINKSVPDVHDGISVLLDDVFSVFLLEFESNIGHRYSIFQDDVSFIHACITQIFKM